MTERPPFSAVITLLAVSRRWEADFADALAGLGINIRKFGLLGHINATPDVSFSELARRSRITVQSAHTAVETLIEAGLVRDATANAGSASKLQITDTGRDLLREAEEEVAAMDARCAETFPELVEALRLSLARTIRS